MLLLPASRSFFSRASALCAALCLLNLAPAKAARPPLISIAIRRRTTRYSFSERQLAIERWGWRRHTIPRRLYRGHSFRRNMRGAVVFADFDNGAIIKAFTFDADVRIGNGTAQPADGFSISYARSERSGRSAMSAEAAIPRLTTTFGPPAQTVKRSFRRRGRKRGFDWVRCMEQRRNRNVLQRSGPKHWPGYRWRRCPRGWNSGPPISHSDAQWRLHGPELDSNRAD